MSWGGSEFSTRNELRCRILPQPGVVYFAASGGQPRGDLAIHLAQCRFRRRHQHQPQCRQPALSRQELAWQSSGGGPSVYETRPGYQDAISTIVRTRRGTPDVSADADPSTGVWVYAYPYWYIVGGTSVAAPVWAGIVNSAGQLLHGKSKRTHQPLCESGERLRVHRRHTRFLRAKSRLSDRRRLGLLHRHRQPHRKGGEVVTQILRK